jgi:hypothetical protein
MPMCGISHPAMKVPPEAGRDVGIGKALVLKERYRHGARDITRHAQNAKKLDHSLSANIRPGHVRQRQKSLNLPGDNSVYRTVR